MLREETKKSQKRQANDTTKIKDKLKKEQEQQQAQEKENDSEPKMGVD